MPLLKRFSNWTGLDNKNHPLNTDGSSAIDTENLQLNDRGELELRPGFDLEASSAEPRGVFDYVEENQLITVDDDVKVLGVGSFSTATKPSLPSVMDTGDNAERWSSVEWNGIIYLARKDTGLKKFDGLNFYAAGIMPVFGMALGPTTGGSLAPAQYDYIVQAEHFSRDFKGDRVLSPYEVIENVTVGGANNSVTGTITIGGLNPDFGMNNIFAANISGALQQSTALSVVFTVESGHTIKVGDWVFCRVGSNLDTDPFYLFECTAISATTVTISNPQGLSLNFRDDEIISPYLANLYRRVSGVGNYQFVQSKCWSTGLGASTVTTPFFKDNVATPTDDEFIFPNDRLFLPPKCKYVASFQGVIVLGNGSFTSEVNGFEVAPDPIEKHTIYWSSTGINDSVEMFSSTNSLIIGESSEGEITGLAVNNDTLLVFKQRGIYAVSGNIILGNIRVEKIAGSEIGCSSHHTIKDVDGALIFLSDKGFYAMRGGSTPVKIGEKVENLIKNGGYDLANAYAAHNFVRDQYACFIPHSTNPDIVLVYDYDFKAWLKWVGIDANNGIVEFGDEFYFVDSSSRLQKMTDARVDDPTGAAPTPVDWFYRTNWDHLGEPAVPKKFVYLQAYSLDSQPAYSLRVRSYIDFNSSNAKTDVTMTMGPTATLPFSRVKFFAGENKVHAIQILFSGSSSSNISLSAWEVEYETPYKKMKE